jgi:hypothetical protein
MEDPFAFLTPNWLKRAHVYHGNLGPFRYRFAMDGENKTVNAAVYEDICYEKAQHIRTLQVPWDDAGVDQLRLWLNREYAAGV